MKDFSKAPTKSLFAGLLVSVIFSLGCSDTKIMTQGERLAPTSREEFSPPSLLVIGDDIASGYALALKPILSKYDIHSATISNKSSSYLSQNIHTLLDGKNIWDACLFSSGKVDLIAVPVVDPVDYEANMRSIHRAIQDKCNRVYFVNTPQIPIPNAAQIPTYNAIVENIMVENYVEPRVIDLYGISGSMSYPYSNQSYGSLAEEIRRVLE